jgi:uncharacterized membrane protein
MIKSNIESPVDIKKIRLNMKKKEAKKMKKNMELLQLNYIIIVKIILHFVIIILYKQHQNIVIYTILLLYIYIKTKIMIHQIHPIHPIHQILINKKDYLISQFRHL